MRWWRDRYQPGIRLPTIGRKEKERKAPKEWNKERKEEWGLVNDGLWGSHRWSELGSREKWILRMYFHRLWVAGCTSECLDSKLGSTTLVSSVSLSIPVSPCSHLGNKGNQTTCLVKPLSGLHAEGLEQRPHRGSPPRVLWSLFYWCYLRFIVRHRKDWNSFLIRNKTYGQRDRFPDQPRMTD